VDLYGINRYHLKSFEAFLRQFGIILPFKSVIGFIFDSVDFIQAPLFGRVLMVGLVGRVIGGNGKGLY